jgi:putative transposase
MPTNALGTHDPLVRTHSSYRALAAADSERCAAYRALVIASVNDEEIAAIRAHLQRQHAFGSRRFRAAIEAQLGRRAGPAKIGRPRKADGIGESAL